MRAETTNTAAGSARDAALQVLLIRYWQMVLNERLKARPFRVPVHLAMGHEAVAVGLDRSMEDGDQLALTHRNVAYHLARLKSLEPLVAEYEGYESGLCQGRLGSMNLMNPGLGMAYTSSILGNNLPVSCGLAWAERLQESGKVVFALTGDGAMEEGAFYESLVFARSHALPLVIVVENNDHSLASRICERRSDINMAGLSAAVGVDFLALSGNRADLYEDKLRQARNAAAARGPVCIEVAVKTQCNHAGPTPGWPADSKSIDLRNGLIIEESDNDPAWVSREALGEAEYLKFAASMLGGQDLSSHAEVACPVI